MVAVDVARELRFRCRICTERIERGADIQEDYICYECEPPVGENMPEETFVFYIHG